MRQIQTGSNYFQNYITPYICLAPAVKHLCPDNSDITTMVDWA